MVCAKALFRLKCALKPISWCVPPGFNATGNTSLVLRGHFWAKRARPGKVPSNTARFIEQPYPNDIGTNRNFTSRCELKRCTSVVAIECKGMHNFLNKKLLKFTLTNGGLTVGMDHPQFESFVKASKIQLSYCRLLAIIRYYTEHNPRRYLILLQ